MEGIVRVGVAVYVLKNQKLLILKRKGKHGAGFWGTPGGHLEFGETPEQCAFREVAEESGVQITNVRLGCVTNDFFAESNKHYVTLHMVADYVSGEARVLEPEKCELWTWLAWDDLPSPLLVPVVNAQKQGFNPFK